MNYPLYGSAGIDMTTAGDTGEGLVQQTEHIDFVTYTFEYTTLEIECDRFYDELSQFGVDTSGKTPPPGKYVRVNGQLRLLERACACE